MILELPWPPKELFPNFRNSNHWRKSNKQIKGYRTTCCWLAKIAEQPESYDFKVVFHPPDKRKRDRDGIIGAFKAGQDGLADAWGIDDSIITMEYHFDEPVKNGCVLIFGKPHV